MPIPQGETDVVHIFGYDAHYLQQPVRVSPGEELRLECHWNNAGFTPNHGEPVSSVPDLNWGEGTGDEPGWSA
jgi:hypothetical protein